MIGMAVGGHHDVDIARFIAGRAKPFAQVAVNAAGAQLFEIAAQKAVAGVEQHDLFAGVDQSRREWMHIAVRIDAVGDAQRARLVGGMFRTVTRMQAFADRLAVENGGDFEFAELEAIDGPLQFTLHCSRHGSSSQDGF